jgi:hypothetical protein
MHPLSQLGHGVLTADVRAEFGSLSYVARPVMPVRCRQRRYRRFGNPGSRITALPAIRICRFVSKDPQGGFV